MRVEIFAAKPDGISTHPQSRYVSARLTSDLNQLVFFGNDPDDLRRLAEHFGDAADRLTVLLQEPAA